MRLMFTSLSRCQHVQNERRSLFLQQKKNSDDDGEAGSRGSPPTVFMKVKRFRDERKWCKVELKRDRRYFSSPLCFLKVGVIDGAPREPGD